MQIINYLKHLASQIPYVKREYYAYKASSMLKSIEENGIGDNIFNFTYKDLYYLLNYSHDYSKMPQFYKDIDKINADNIARLRNKNKIKIAFYIYTSSMWSCDLLYQLFVKDSLFEPVIVVVDAYTTNDYTPTVTYFRERGYNVVAGYDYTGFTHPWKEIRPDIVILLTPYTDFSPRQLSSFELPLTTTTYYIHYGLSVSGIKDGWNPYNLRGMITSSKYFCDTINYVDQYTKKSMTQGKNIIYSGHPKMDVFYNNTIRNDKNQIWKVPQNIDINDITKIIYAPHYSISDAGIQFSTFDMNYQFIYQFARDNPFTSWIIKPHPLLRKTTVLQGLFKTLEEYDAYLDAWDSLPNARVIRQGSYFDEFKTSDGMILDSSSFFMEYQYTHKPLLFLRRDTQTFTDLSKELLDISYSANGDDFKAIELFINDILINKNDYLKPMRDLFFEKNLDYVKDNGMLASEFIYHTILRDTGKLT